MNGKKLLELTDEYFQKNGIKIFTSEKIESKIDEAVALFYSGKRPDKIKTLKLACKHFISHLYNRTNYITVNNEDITDYDLFYILDIRDYDIKNSILEKYKNKDVVKSASNSKVYSKGLPSSPYLPITIGSTFKEKIIDEYDLVFDCNFGFRTISREDKLLLSLDTRNLPMITALEKVGIIEISRDKSKQRKNILYKPTPKYRLNPEYFISMNEVEVYDKRTVDKFTQIYDRLNTTFGLKLEHNMVEAVNMFNLLNLDFERSDLYRYCHNQYPIGTVYKGKTITNDKIVYWVEYTMGRIEKFKQYDSSVLPRGNFNGFRTFHWFNSIPKACRQFITSYSGLIERDATSMHWNNAIRQFFIDTVCVDIPEEEYNLLVESQGDSKTFFSEKLNIYRSDIGDKLNKYLYSKNSDASKSVIGKWIVDNIPTFNDWCREIKAENKKEMVKLLYPSEFEFINMLKMKSHENGVPVITCHDAIFVSENDYIQYLTIEEQVINELNILSIMKDEAVPHWNISKKLLEEVQCG